MSKAPTQEAKQEGLGCGCPMWSNPFTGKRENNHNQLCREKWALKLNDQLYRDMTTADRFDALYAVLVEFLAAHDRETNLPVLLGALKAAQKYFDLCGYDSTWEREQGLKIKKMIDEALREGL